MARAYFRLFFDQYIPLVEGLTDAERGRLLWGMMRYARDGDDPDFMGNERYIWPFVREDIDRDKIAYIRKCARNAENGRKGGLKKQENLANATHCDREEAEAYQAEEANEAEESNQANQAEEAEEAKEANQANKWNPESTQSNQAAPVLSVPGGVHISEQEFHRRWQEHLRNLIRPEDLDFDHVCREAKRYEW